MNQDRIGQLEKLGIQSRVESNRGECKRKSGEITRRDRRMSKLTEVLWGPLQRAGVPSASKSRLRG